MVKNGVLEDKFNSCYKDVNVLNYRMIFNEVVSNYRGKNLVKFWILVRALVFFWIL